MTESNVELLRKGYEDFAAGDVPAVLALFSEDITWHVPGRNLLSGDFNGHDSVLGFFQKLVELSDGTFNLDVEDVLDGRGDKLAVLVTEDAERKGDRLTVPAVHVWTFQDGKATSFQAFQHDDHEMDAFWS